MNERQSKILTAVIEEFIDTNNLVSSDFLFSEMGFNNVSTATIRNDLFALEGEGYLKKQHISSGRTPTVKGYDFFVQSILENIKEPKDDKFNPENLEELFSYLSEKVHLPGICGVLNKGENFKTGLKFLSEYPEFKDSDYTFDFLELFENFENYFNKFDEYFDDANKQFSVFIGDSKISKKFKPFSLISRVVGSKNGKVLMMFIGPYRMDYRSAIRNLLNFN